MKRIYAYENTSADYEQEIRKLSDKYLFNFRELLQGKGKMKEHNSFTKGIKDGLPICLGYLSVAFAFGIFATENGLNILEALLISMTNVTSAGQLAGVPIIVSGGTLIELAVSQLIINLRYALMSISLSQKLGRSIKLFDRFIISFVNTDEVFAVASAKASLVGRNYMYGLILMPYIGWSMGTLLGAGAGNILPASVVSALGIAIYGMFVAIVIPQVKKSRQTAMCVLTAVILSCVFKYVPMLNEIPSGFTVIICAALASLIFAAVMPVENKEATDDERI